MENSLLYGAIIIIILFFVIMPNQNKENFYLNLVPCADCSTKTFKKCMDCSNCGICVDMNNNIKCISGDENRPYDKKNCAYWVFDSFATEL